MGKTIHINGIDFTSLFAPFGYSISYRKVQGGGQTTMRDGSTVHDVLAVKATVRHNCMPLTDTQLARLLATLYKDSFSVRYYDPRLGAEYRTSTFVGSATQATESGKGADGEVRWTGITITLEEI